MTYDFEIDPNILEEAKKLDFIRLQKEREQEEKRENIRICVRNKICPKCGGKSIYHRCDVDSDMYSCNLCNSNFSI